LERKGDEQAKEKNVGARGETEKGITINGRKSAGGTQTFLQKKGIGKDMGRGKGGSQGKKVAESCLGQKGKNALGGERGRTQVLLFHERGTVLKKTKPLLFTVMNGKQPLVWRRKLEKNHRKAKTRKERDLPRGKKLLMGEKSSPTNKKKGHRLQKKKTKRKKLSREKEGVEEKASSLSGVGTKKKGGKTGLQKEK